MFYPRPNDTTLSTSNLKRVESDHAGQTAEPIDVHVGGRVQMRRIEIDMSQQTKSCLSSLAWQMNAS
jgi:hypothetical protein